MNPTHLALCLNLMLIGAIFLIFAVIFAVKKEKACKLISGFNFFTEAQQAEYDKARIVQDYFKLFRIIAVLLFIGAALCLWLGWWAYAPSLAVMLFLLFRDFHVYAEKAFEKYKLNP
ncbi:MAG: DUF3784 domain-containing protein [Clostridia bacterium]|nr:DUF3784 domain-containing protein [Clostridia bacterium]